jgi:uncharacterized damage-inducible protein DinB
MADSPGPALELLPTVTPDWLATPVTYSRRGRTATLPLWVVLRHIVNHITYYRGQVASAAGWP